MFFGKLKKKTRLHYSTSSMFCNGIDIESKNRLKVFQHCILRPTTTREKVFNFVFPGTNKRRSKTWVWVLSFTEWTQMEQGNCKMHRISVQLKVFCWRIEWKLNQKSFIRLSSPLRSLIPAKQSALIFVSFVAVRTNRKSKNLPQFMTRECQVSTANKETFDFIPFWCPFNQANEWNNFCCFFLFANAKKTETLNVSQKATFSHGF